MSKVSKLPEAQDIADGICSRINPKNGLIKTALLGFAKLHVEAALKEASKKAECCTDAIVDLGHTIIEAYVEEDSILNAYPLTNIK